MITNALPKDIKEILEKATEFSFIRGENIQKFAAKATEDDFDKIRKLWTEYQDIEWDDEDDEYEYQLDLAPELEAIVMKK